MSKDDYGNDYEFDTYEDIEEYEDEYVYGDSEDVDLSELYREEYEFEDGDYGVSGNQYRGKYASDVYGEDEDVTEGEEEEKLTLGERLSKVYNKGIDFIDSKRFTQIQIVIAIGMLMFIGVVTYLLIQAGTNVASNVDIQEESVRYSAQKTARTQYENQEELELARQEQDDERQQYIDSNRQKYDEVVGEEGVPEGYIALQDADGEVELVKEEDYYSELIEAPLRETTDETPDEEKEDDIEIRPASRVTWEEIVAGNLSEEGEELYQTKGEFIYFGQKSLALMYPNNIFYSDFDTETKELSVTLRSDPNFELDKDFEARMKRAYRNSGFQAEDPDALKITYDKMTLEEYIDEQS